MAADSEGAALFALLIGLQNLPEGCTSRHGRISGSIGGRKAASSIVQLAPIGPVNGMFRCFWLARQDAAEGAIALFAADGMLRLAFRDIASRRRLNRYRQPLLGIVPEIALSDLAAVIF
ncbi:MAG: hypothetical protein OXI87_15140 [Albidovulum sp.]|nr:hypothetical protein [Albidovulum sp.]MDE0306191.1 hypothetical protein [Albidovulum sp.]MDE0530330.1 hypothetical protein [Albidovulum sp.]